VPESDDGADAALDAAWSPADAAELASPAPADWPLGAEAPWPAEPLAEPAVPCAPELDCAGVSATLLTVVLAADGTLDPEPCEEPEP